MKIQTFRAASMREALAAIRRELGPGASVLHAREVNTGPVARLLRGRVVEVAATPDPAPLAEQAARRDAELAGASRGRADVAPIAEPPIERLAATPTQAEPEPTPAATPTAPDPWLEAYGRLLDADVEPAIAQQLIADARSEAASEGYALNRIVGTTATRLARRSLSKKLSATGGLRITPGRRRVVALVGPTGVGKTTTLAKLAAGLRIREGARVGLVTVDTFRVAAVDQLGAYAQIIDLPMEVVATPDDMRAALDRLADVDLVLIDTAGRSPRDEARIAELRTLLEAARPDETHLVLSVTATARSLVEAIRRFGSVGPTALSLTKLDEAVRIGHVAEPLLDAGLPIAYLTDGQSVPEDIRVAERETLAAELIGEESVDAGQASIATAVGGRR